MGVREFINNVAEFLEVDDFVQSSRKKFINDLSATETPAVKYINKI